MTESARAIRVLYVCPWAHRSGHMPQAVIRESSALLEAGAQVSVCTFRGILDREEPLPVPHRLVVSGGVGRPLGAIAHLLGLLPGGKHLARFVEHVATLGLAVRLRKALGYEVIYLRDGDPFIFVPFVLGLVLRDYRWAVSLLGTRSVRSRRSLYGKLVGSRLWKPVYRRSFSRNRFSFICGNGYLKGYFESDFLDGTLSGKVHVVPEGLEIKAERVAQAAARQRLGLPQDRLVFLHFGALHPDKDIETVLEALRDMPEAVLVHAGDLEGRIDLGALARRKGLQGRVIVKDCYIPESEKPYYFASADAIVLSYSTSSWIVSGMLWQAARFGLPAIASNGGDLGELVERYGIGLVFEAGSAASLGSALSQFSSSGQKKRATMAGNCERFCDDFSYAVWATNLMKVLAELSR